MIRQNKGTIEYPQVGDIRSGRELGRKSVGKLIYSPCITCGQCRWVQIIKGKPCHLVCFPCAMKSSHHRNAISIAMKSKCNHLGKHHSESTKRKMAILAMGRKGEKNGFYGKTHTPESKAKNSISNSIALKELWKNPEYHERTVMSILKGIHKRPTSYEQKIIDLIEEYNLPFRYVGDGQAIIEYKNPDFINTNGQKILIETYSIFWHKSGYEKERTKIFADYGYKTIFLNDNDLCYSDWKEKCLSKLKESVI